MRVLVCGGRDFTDYLAFVRKMHRIEAEHGSASVIIHGGAKGADWCAHLFANSPVGHCTEISFPANWKLHGKRAGPLRNQQMLDEGRPDFVVAFPGGRGTADMVRRAKAAGVKVVEIEMAN